MSATTELVKESPVKVSMALPARAAAIAWLNAFLAASQDVERPALYRTLCLELHADGAQIIGCDGTALFRTWVPTLEDTAWPALGARRVRTIIVMDPDGFGVGFMKTLLRLTGEEGHAADELKIETMESDEDAAPSLGDEFQTERLVLRAAGQRIDLRLMDDKYPNWRATRLGVLDSERVDGLSIAPRLLGLVAKLKDVRSVDLEFHGEGKYISFTVSGAKVQGFIMPMRRQEKEAKPAAKADDSQGELRREEEGT